MDGLGETEGDTVWLCDELGPGEGDLVGLCVGLGVEMCDVD